MDSLEQFLFILVPAVIAAGGIGAALLHRSPSREARARQTRRTAMAGRHDAARRRARARRRQRA